jgi:hypothetical protein
MRGRGREAYVQGAAEASEKVSATARKLRCHPMI